MRVKEYLIVKKMDIDYLDEIERVLNDLKLIRHNEELTGEYFDNILMTDERYENWKKDYEEWSVVVSRYGSGCDENGSLGGEPQHIEYENEIDKDVASDFRLQLRKIVKEDKSYGYIYRFLMMKNENITYRTKDFLTKEQIEEAIFEDMILQQQEDEQRISELQYQLNDTKDEIDRLENENITNNIQLSSKKNTQIDFIRIINCLYELDFFKSTDIKKELSKKEVFDIFGKVINKDLSTFSQQLTTAKKSANNDKKALKRIFQKMLDMQQ